MVWRALCHLLKIAAGNIGGKRTSATTGSSFYEAGIHTLRTMDAKTTPRQEKSGAGASPTRFLN